MRNESLRATAHPDWQQARVWRCRMPHNYKLKKTWGGGWCSRRPSNCKTPASDSRRVNHTPLRHRRTGPHCSILREERDREQWGGHRTMFDLICIYFICHSVFIDTPCIIKFCLVLISHDFYFCFKNNTKMTVAVTYCMDFLTFCPWLLHLYGVTFNIYTAL